MPKVFMTWKIRDLPALDEDRVSSWARCNPGWTVELHSDDSMDAWMRRRAPTRLGRVYADLRSGACRADLWRYCVLAAEGGAYADVDCRCLRTGLLDELWSRGKLVASVDHVPRNAFQGFLVAPRGCPLLLLALETICSSFDRGLYANDVFRFTGPAMLGELLRRELALGNRLAEGEWDSALLLRHHGFRNDRITWANDTIVRCQEPVRGKRQSGGYGLAWSLTRRDLPDGSPEPQLFELTRNVVVAAASAGRKKCPPSAEEIGNEAGARSV